MHEWIRIAFRKSTFLRALKCAVIVGPVLIAINHGRAILEGSISAESIISMTLTAIVPFCVSTVSTVGAALEKSNGVKPGEKTASQA
jgi:hypothetical protein